MAAFGRFGRTRHRDRFVQGAIVGGAVGLVRAGSSVARAIQSGYLRAYALLLLIGVAAPRPLLPDRELGVMTIHLSIVVFLPLAAGAGRRASCRAHGRAGWCPPARVAVLALRGRDDRRLRLGRRAGLQYVTDDAWISELGIRYSLGVDGLNLFLLVPHGDRLGAAHARGRPSASATAPRLFFFHLALAETAVLGAFIAQDLALFVVFFDLMLVPFYFLIGGWGTRRRACAATTKFVIYTLVGSLLMLAGAVALGVLSRRRRRADLVRARRPRRAHAGAEGTQYWIFLLFAARVPRQGAGLPAARLDARRPTASTPIPVLIAVLAPCCRRSASTASCGSCCRSMPDASAALPGR